MQRNRWKKSLKAIAGWVAPVFAMAIGMTLDERSAGAVLSSRPQKDVPEPLVLSNPLDSEKVFQYAGHRSHSSHSSHSSHYSSSYGGHASHASHSSHYSSSYGGYDNTPSVPAYTPEPTPVTAPTPVPIRVRPKPLAAPGITKKGSSISTRIRLNGDELKKVLELVQLHLILEGYDPGPIDGALGNTTREALKQYQKDNGLKVTGYLDASTLRKLRVFPKQ